MTEWLANPEDNWGDEIAWESALEIAKRLDAIPPVVGWGPIDQDTWWTGVIGKGESHVPSGEIRSIKHMHPAMVKPIYDAHKGTAVADVIAGLIFDLSISHNREQFLVADANERRAAAEQRVDELETMLSALPAAPLTTDGVGE